MKGVELHQSEQAIGECHLTFIPQPTTRCPKCGHTDAETGSLKMCGEALGNLAGDYCFWCYAEWIIQHVPRMVEVAK